MKKAIRMIVPLIFIVLILTSIAWYLFDYDRTFTRDVLLSQARFHDSHGNSRLSSWFYDQAYTFSGKDEDVAIELANQYVAAGNFTKAEATLAKAISSAPSVDLYTALSKLFVAQDKLLDAFYLLERIPAGPIKDQINAMRPSDPTPNIAPGYYSDYLDIRLSSTADAIFYTSEVDWPSIRTSAYYSPIALPAGTTTIRAIGVNNTGLVSALVRLDYTIAGIVEEVSFIDPALDITVRQMVSVNPGSTLYSNQLWGITEFTAPQEAAIFTDLVLLPNLEKLTIHNHVFDSLNFLSSLTNLKYLDLTGCTFSTEELSVIASLPSLSELCLAGCSLSSVSGLEYAPALSVLDLSNNTVRNLEPIAAMVNLTKLDLQHNAVTGLEALSGMTSLQSLNLSYNSVTDITPLVTCSNLSWLDISNNQVSQLIALGNMPQLTYFAAEYNSISDVSPLAVCTNLTTLNIGSNTISDISFLYTLTKLEVFDCSANQISSLPNWPAGSALRTIYGSYNSLQNIDVLSQMPSISYIYMDHNMISNINSLAGCYTLVQVNVFDNPISDVSALREHDIIVNYDPTY